jgi:hypothetical protein
VVTRRGSVRFAGYAAWFDRLDDGGDIIRPGAFREALACGRNIPVLWQHKPGAVVGRVDAIREDLRGLRVIGSVRTQGAARDVAELVRSGRLDGLSFGYRVRRSRKLDGVRELLSLDLVEVSLVSRPMQPLARIHAVES